MICHVVRLLWLCWRAKGEWNRLADMTDASAPLRPAARSEHVGAWDKQRQVLLIHAGSNLEGDLWSFDAESATWTRILNGASPAARALHAADWDSTSGALWMHGGRNSQTATWFRDVWKLQSGTWSLEYNDVIAPCGRQAHVAVWISSTSSLWVHGGWTGTKRLSDLWSYNTHARSWQQLAPLAPDGAPPARSHHFAAWDGARQTLWMHGGYNDVLLGDLWTLTLDASTLSWAPVLAGGGPTARSGHAGVWDATGRALWLHGGNDGVLQRDLWKYDSIGDTWSLIAAHAGPSGRWSHVAAWDGTNQVIYIHGGYNGSVCGDLWSFSVTTTSTTHTSSLTSTSSSQTSTSSSISRTSSSSSSRSSTTTTSRTGTSSTSMSFTSSSTTSSSSSSSSSSHSYSTTMSTTSTLTFSTSHTATSSSTSSSSTSNTRSTATATFSTSTTATTTSTTEFCIPVPWPDWLLAALIGMVLLVLGAVCSFSSLEAVQPFVSFTDRPPEPQVLPVLKRRARRTQEAPVFPRLGPCAPRAPLVVLVHFQGASRVSPRTWLVPESIAFLSQVSISRQQGHEPQPSPTLPELPPFGSPMQSSERVPARSQVIPQDSIPHVLPPKPPPTFSPGTWPLQQAGATHARRTPPTVTAWAPRTRPRVELVPQPPPGWPSTAFGAGAILRRETKVRPWSELALLLPLPHACTYMQTHCAWEKSYLPDVPSPLEARQAIPGQPSPLAPSLTRLEPTAQRSPSTSTPFRIRTGLIGVSAASVRLKVVPGSAGVPRKELVPRSRLAAVAPESHGCRPARPVLRDPRNLSPRSRFLGLWLPDVAQGQPFKRELELPQPRHPRAKVFSPP
ncbi:Lztr1 [Symbiodinium sp. CCMP2592]|nr:Lztr1 [Symbiodinium sp. CCMP2592]